MRHTRIYSIWCDMKKRCNNPKCKNYIRYGANGITVCSEWNDNFVAFYEWSMKNGYKNGLTLDRIKNDKGYSPDNCRWVTMREQNNNRANNIKVTYQGKTQTLKQWCDELNLKDETTVSVKHHKPINKALNGLKYKTVWMRINVYGWDEERALTTPVMRSKKHNS